MNIAVVIPTIREDCIQRWLGEWAEDLDGLRIIAVEDNPEATFSITGAEHYSWQDIGREMGDDSWIIPRRTDGIRSFGFLKAVQGGADVIWTLDDDCYPEAERKGTYRRHLEAFFDSTPAPDDSWYNTIPGTGLFPRGYPYGIRESARPVMLHHGLWSSIPDLDGETQLANPDFRLPPCQYRDVVPSRKFFPMCIMNIAFRAEAAPVMYQLLMGQEQDGTPWGFDRFADIWAGVLMKKTIDHLGWACTSGAPSIRHSRASDPHKNVQLEAAGRIANERFWEHIQDTRLDGSTPGECYLELADAVDGCEEFSPRRDYWHSLAAAMRLWVRYVLEG